MEVEGEEVEEELDVEGEEEEDEELEDGGASEDELLLEADVEVDEVELEVELDVLVPDKAMTPKAIAATNTITITTTAWIRLIALFWLKVVCF